VPPSDWVTVFVACCFLLLILISIELINKWFQWNRIYLRKFVHIFVGLLICATSLLIESKIPILLISGIFILFDWWAVKNRYLKSIHLNGQSYGTVYYPISIFLLALLLWDAHKAIFLVSILIMIVPDALAGLAGMRFANNHYIILTEKKSIPGALVMFFSSMIIFFFAYNSYFNKDIWFSMSAAFLTGIAITAAELLSHKGSDNLSVPLLTAMIMYAFLQDKFMYAQLSLGILMAMVVSILSYRVKFLDLSGAFGAFLLGLVIFGFGGWLFTVPILMFYITSSILSVIGRKRKQKFQASFEKTGVRDVYQVYANGGIPGILVLVNYFFPDPVVYYMYLAALASATADTWATEIGVFSRTPPRMITSMGRVEPGRSGAVSLTGLIAALTGSFIIAYPGLLLYPQAFDKVFVIIVIILSGFSGNLLDSLIGASIQAQFICKSCGKQTERKIHCGAQTEHHSGSLFMNNDLVNMLSIAFGSMIFYICYQILN